MRKKTTITKVLILSLAISIVSMSLGNAQNRDHTDISVKSLPRISISPGMGIFNADFNGQNISLKFLQEHLGDWLGTNGDHSYKLVKENKDDVGIRHLVYEHYYKKIKVMDDMILIHEKDGKITHVNGEIITDIPSSSGQKKLNSQKIKSIIIADLNPQGKIKISDAEVVITKVNKARKTAVFYTSKIDALSFKPLKAYTYYIDNATGAVVKKNSRVHDTDTPSTSATYYKGNQSVTVDSYNGQFRLKDNVRNIHTMNGTNLDIDTISGGIINVGEYMNPVADYTADDTKPPVEVHWGMKNAYDYYMTKHNRNSYDGNGAKIDNYYNFDFGGLQGGANAAALDTPLYGGIVCMLYGNGKILGGMLTLMNPVVGLDVAGHEYSHLIIGRNGLGGLNYEAESGAINESIADMLGTAIEFYSGASPNWTIGEGIPTANILTPNPSPYMRNMSDPNNVNPGPQPDTYLGVNWVNTADTSDSNDYGGVHTNSGVGNYWFYLLSQGGSGTNDIGNAYNVSGITIEKAEKIIYRALMNYMTPNTTYLDAYNATKQAVADLYGAESNEQQQNVSAWYAVGIGTGVLSTTESTRKENDQLTIYPNPVKDGVFTIENNNNNAFVEIFDAAGRLIKPAQKLDNGANTIYIKNTQKGIYILKITSNRTVISTKKIIVE
ncbi:T9SS C-terminal target domain-containing protein [Chryseobacterium indologenes]|uniref:Neutral metalloproteinase n=1 Tax=Chryseobacterium indologenes TaxID=253 RepID=A0AAD0YYV3_CHRID|nr:M4 family metallopeptidase [Chryseobacterium indologenes]AZB17364.1 T9SS C-terminal target domain-containing protein [Chryseobacterium indologenes]